MHEIQNVNHKSAPGKSSHTTKVKISYKAIHSIAEQPIKGFVFIWDSDALHNEPYRPTDGWYTLFKGRADDKLYTLIIAVNTGFLPYSNKAPDLPKPKSNRFTSAQSRQIGFNFRMLSDLLIRYRYQEWTDLNDKEQYYIENIEWSLINYCTNCASAGISLYSEDATSLYYRITTRIEKVYKQIQAVIDSRKEDTAKITKLGTWALKLGAVISSDNHDQLHSLLNSYDTSLEHKASAKMVAPTVARLIGINFSRVSDLILKFHYLNWEHLDSAQRSNLQNIEIIILNYNSNFGGLGIKLGKGQKEGLMEQVFDRSKEFVTVMSQLAEKNIGSYNRVMELGNRMLDLGAALTGEDVQAIQNILKEKVNFEGLEIKFGKGETKGMVEQVLGKSNWELVTALSPTAEKNVASYDQAVELGDPVIPLGAVALTEESMQTVEKTLEEHVNFDGYNLGRKMGLKFRNMAFLLLKYRYNNWDVLTKKEKYCLENLEFTLTNFNSNFAVFGLDINPGRDEKLVVRIDAAIKRIVNTLENEMLSYQFFFAAGMEGVKLGAAIFTENTAVIKKAAAFSTANAKQFGNATSDALARDVALKMRIIADTLLKQRYENWNCFTKKEGEALGNIEWTLMNFASNFAVLGIDLDSHERRGILECAARKLDAQIKTLGTLKPYDLVDKTSLFKLGIRVLKTGATLTTEEISATKAVLGNH